MRRARRKGSHGHVAGKVAVGFPTKQGIKKVKERGQRGQMEGKAHPGISRGGAGGINQQAGVNLCHTKASQMSCAQPQPTLDVCEMW